jgi:putative ABC transport system ATP-binding protein
VWTRIIPQFDVKFWTANEPRRRFLPLLQIFHRFRQGTPVAVSKHMPLDTSVGIEEGTDSSLSRTAVFRCRNVSKVYHMGEVEVHALSAVELDLFEGEMAVLLGASGSGKSTLLNIIGGLDVPSSGEVIFRDHNLTAATDSELTIYRRDHVGFVFQFYNLIPSLTALENVQLITEISAHPLKAEDALKLVGLRDRMGHFPAQLSGGEQQRVAIARAIAKQPDVLLCDEPTGALDYGTGKIVLEAIERANRELGTTTIVITHNAPIARMADRVIRISSGRIVSVISNKTKARPSELEW